MAVGVPCFGPNSQGRFILTSPLKRTFTAEAQPKKTRQVSPSRTRTRVILSSRRGSSPLSSTLFSSPICSPGPSKISAKGGLESSGILLIKVTRARSHRIFTSDLSNRMAAANNFATALSAASNGGRSERHSVLVLTWRSLREVNSYRAPVLARVIGQEGGLRHFRGRFRRNFLLFWPCGSRRSPKNHSQHNDTDDSLKLNHPTPPVRDPTPPWPACRR